MRAVCSRYGVAGAVLGLADQLGERTLHFWGSVQVAGRQEPPRPDHRFLLTSVSKVVTAAQALSLVESGDADVDDPVARLVPEFGCNGKHEVTFAHVLSHTSGVRRRTANTAERLTPGLAAADHLRRALRAKASWQPGTRVEYSSSPFWALAEACTRARGASYDRWLEPWLRERIGATICYAAAPKAPRRYVEPVQPLARQFAEQTRRVAYPAGGMVASTEDALRFGQAFLDGGPVPAPLPAPLLERMRTPMTAGLRGRREPQYDGNATERALGWGLGGPGRRRPDGVLWHAGVSGTSIWVDRDNGIVVVFLSAHWFLPRTFFGELIDGLYGRQSR
jgi:CubicO group peptidase (beta-lactamase class C family)